MNIKTCKDCKENKPLSEFYSQEKVRKNTGEIYTYYQPYCKECASKRSSKWQKENHEYYIVSKSNYHKNRRINDPEFRMQDIQRIKELRKTGYFKEYYNENKEYFSEYYRERRMNKTHEISDYEWFKCKEYFDNGCAYCGLYQDNHYIIYAGELKKTDLHKEHVDHNGSNKIDNCVPACQKCNSNKWAFEFEQWYNEENEVFSMERLNKIIKWLTEDWKMVLL